MVAERPSICIDQYPAVLLHGFIAQEASTFNPTSQEDAFDETPEELHKIGFHSEKEKPFLPDEQGGFPLVNK